MTPPAPSSPRFQSGQVMPLAAISLLVLAVMLMLDLNVLRSVHERIRLQNYSDETAFGLAVQEARSMNYYAYTNRAIASAYVGAIGLSTFQSMAAMTADADWGMFMIFLEIVGEVQAEADAEWASWDFVDAALTEVGMLEALADAFIYLADWAEGSIGNDVQKLDSDFASAVNQYVTHANFLYYTEVFMALANGALFIPSGTSGIGGGEDPIGLLKNNFNTNSTLSGAGTTSLSGATVAVANVASYINALDTSSSNDKITAMTSVVNSTRTPWDWDRGGPVGLGNIVPPTLFYPLDWTTLANQCEIGTMTPILGVMQGGFNLTIGGKTSAKTIFLGLGMGSGIAAMNGSGSNPYGSIGGLFNSSPGQAEIGDSFSSKDDGMLDVSWSAESPAEGEGNGMWPLGAFFSVIPGMVSAGYIASGGVNAHDDNLIDILNHPHDSSAKHDSNSLGLSPAHFMEYNASPSTSGSDLPPTYHNDYNQPVVYWTAKSNLNVNDFNSVGPWTGPQGGGNSGAGSLGKAVGIDLGGSNGSTSLTLYNQNPGIAISKAAVYYHRLGDWQEDPNLWNPYWRAKLDAWKSAAELGAAALAGGAPTTASAEVAVMGGLMNGAMNVRSKF